MHPHAVSFLLHLVDRLAFTTWLGSLIYICFILPPLPDQAALPPVFVRMMGLMRFRVYGAASLALVVALEGLWPLIRAHGVVGGGQELKLLLLAACVFSSLQLEGFLRTATARKYSQPMPAIGEEDAAAADKLLRQIDKVTTALAFMGLAVLVVSAVS